MRITSTMITVTPLVCAAVVVIVTTSCVLPKGGLPCDGLECDQASSTSSSSTANTTGGGFGGEGGMTATTTVSSSSMGGGGSGGVGGFGGQGGATTSSSSMGGGGAGGCGVGEKDCNGSCEALDDPSFGCDDPSCTPCGLFSAVDICSNGACAVGTCDMGFADCDMLDPNGCETSIGDNNMDCGACNNVCFDGQVCQAGQCLDVCYGQPVDPVGVFLCGELNSFWLNAGKYGGIQSSVGAPATNQPGDPITPGCISQEPATVGDLTDPSVRCSLGVHAPGTQIYLGLKAYDDKMPNPPPFFTHMCDGGPPSAVNKCRFPMKVYVNGVLKGSFDPLSPMSPFAYYVQGSVIPMQVLLTVPAP